MISFATPNAAAVPGTRSRREKAQASIPPMGAWAAGSPSVRTLHIEGGGFMDRAIAAVASASVVPMAALAFLEKQPGEFWSGIAGLVLAWAALEIQSVRRSR